MQSVYIGPANPKIGLNPGSMVYTGDCKGNAISMEAILYNQNEIHRFDVSPDQLEQLHGSTSEDAYLWLNVNGLHDTELITKIGSLFEISPLFIEDILNVTQRPKMESGENYLFYVLRMIQPGADGDSLEIEQISMLHGPRFLITFQESPGDVFDSVRQRLLKNIGRLRKAGTDYLAYALFDMIVDYYFLVLDHLREKLEPLEDKALDPSDSDKLPAAVRNYKNQFIILRRSIAPLREVIDSLLRYDGYLWEDATIPFLNDLRDHLLNVVETIDTYRESLSGVLELHLAILSQKMNDVMRILTIIATIFIPLTFAAGLYGMNFEYIPELSWRPGYFVFLGGCLAMAVFMLLLFRWKKWI